MSREVLKIYRWNKERLDTNLYTTPEIENSIYNGSSVKANKVTSVEKANVMMSGVLWRDVMTKLFENEAHGLETEHMYADNQK